MAATGRRSRGGVVGRQELLQQQVSQVVAIGFSREVRAGRRIRQIARTDRRQDHDSRRNTPSIQQTAGW